MTRWIERVALGLLVAAGLVVAALGIFVSLEIRCFDASLAKVYDVPAPAIAIASDEAALARGKHVVEALAPCATRECHASDLAGGSVVDAGPLGTLTAPNISKGGLGAAYTDGELARVVRHGIKKDGRGVRFMPSHAFGWLPDDDLAAAVSYLRTLPPVERASQPMRIGWLGKVLDRVDAVPLDVARRIDHRNPDLAGAPEPTAAYGRHLAKSCAGCHGERMSGGRIPGAPSRFAKPLNLTPHETGLKDWTFDDFDKLWSTGVKKNGRALDVFMPLDAYGKMDAIERRALWEFLRTLPPLPLGHR